MFKSILPIASSLLITVATYSQDPVNWNYTATKIKTPVGETSGTQYYELHITAAIDKGWHLYAQSQPEDAIAIPTTIKFSNNPLIALKGKIKEVGSLHKVKDASVGIEAWQYSDQVDFVQVIKLKSKASTLIKGTIEFQVCTDEKMSSPKNNFLFNKIII